MTDQEASSTPKRLWILDDEEIEALYGRPCFTADDRAHYFTLTQPEQDSIRLKILLARLSALKTSA